MKKKVTISFINRRDLADVVNTEIKCFGEFAWTKEEFMRCLQEENNRAIVSRVEGGVVGHAVYRIQRRRFQLLDIAVHPMAQRVGAGGAMFNTIVGWLTHRGQSRIDLCVRETNLGAQLFFKSMGAVAIEVCRDMYDDIDESAYLMQCRYQPTNEELGDAKNRLTRYLHLG